MKNQAQSEAAKRSWADPEIRARRMANISRGPRSEEACKNVREAAQRRVISPEGKERQRAAHLGKKHSPEFIEKRVAPLRGRKRKPFSDEWRKNITEGQKRRWAKMTAEEKQEFAEAAQETLRRRYAEGFSKKGYHLKPETVAKRIQNGRPYRFSQTGPELDFLLSMFIQGVDCVSQHPVAGHVWDFFVEPNFVIDVDGCYWHRCLEHYPNSPRSTGKREKECNELAIKNGLIPIRVWEHDVWNFDASVFERKA